MAAKPGIDIVIDGDITPLQKAFKQALASNDNLIKGVDRLGDQTEQAGKKGAKGIKDLGSEAKKTGGIFKDAFGGIKSEIESMASGFSNSVPAIGNVASKLGLVGLAAGAAAGALVMVNNATAELGRQARLANLDPETLQAWSSVAKQTRVSQDALVDGFKELSLRAAEFVQTGSGSAGESLQRLGLSATETARLLERPADLMQEIFTRLKNFDPASQRFMLDELFGGTAAEQFVQWLQLGNGELKKMTDEAGKAGDVISNKMVKQAEELDKKFNQVADTISKKLKSAMQTAVVEGADLFDRIGAYMNGTYDQRRGEFTKTDYERTQQMIDDMKAKIAKGEMGSSVGGAYNYYPETIRQLEEQQAERRQELLKIEKEITAERMRAANTTDKTGRLPGVYQGVWEEGRFGDKPKAQADMEATAAATDKKLADEANAAATKAAEAAQKSNTAALNSATNALQGFANAGLTPLQSQAQDLQKVQEEYAKAISILFERGDVEGMKRLAEQRDAAIQGVNVRSARSQDSGSYLQGFNPYGKDIANLQSGLARKLQEMISAMPEGLRNQVVINSGYRDIAKQTQLWNAAVKKYGSEAAARKWVAPPGRSMHGTGQAVDLGTRGGGLVKRGSDLDSWIQTNAGSFGLSTPLSNEAWHVEETGARGKQKVKEEEEFRKQVEASNQKLKEQGQAITDQYDPLANKNRLLAEANELLKAGVITQDVYNARVKDIGKIYDEQVKKMSASNDEMMSALTQLTESWTNSLIDGLIDGNFNWKQFMGQIAKDLLKLAANQALKSIKGGGVGGGGLTGSFGAKASGGQGKGWTVVGERGPELVDLGNGARVYNAPSTRSMFNNSGPAQAAPSINVNTTVTVPTTTDAKDSVRIGREVEKAVRATVQDEMSRYQTSARLRG